MHGCFTPNMLLPVLLCLLVHFHDVQSQDDRARKPEFTDISQIVAGTKINEDVAIGTTVARVKAIDPDGGPITYSISGTADNYLEINPNTGEIFIKVQLDFERNPTLTITVTATDQDGDSQQYGSSLQIDDANDQAPVFEETTYIYSVPEDTNVGYIITNLTVSDDETKNNILTVTCDTSVTSLARACEVFGVDYYTRSNIAWNGYLFLKKKLNFEDETDYSVRLDAFDGLNSKLQEIQIKVVDINDSPPFFVRAQGSVIREGVPSGSYIDFVSARDSDTVKPLRPIRYELYGDPEAVRYFTVDRVNGSIINLLPLDYEDPSRTPGDEFTLQIRARELLRAFPESLGNDSVTTATAVVPIRLLDINDNCPEFDQAVYTVSINEDIAQGSNIPVQMTVTDKDSGSRATFDLELFDPSSTFQVVPTSGRSPASVTISVVKASNIDYETGPRQYDLTVRAKENDVGNETLNCPSSALVRLSINDVNDVNPRFPQVSYRTQVREDARPSTSIFTITAFDPDSGIFGNNGLRYSLIGSGEELFNINPVSGVITVAPCAAQTYGETPCIDYETKRSYDLAVQARDSEGAPNALLGTTQLKIDVIDVNDNVPFFGSAYIRSIREGDVITTDPLLIQAEDPDGRALTYSIPIGQAQARYWQIDPVTGNITATKPIQYSDLPAGETSFRFQALASDGLFEQLVDVTIIVIDVNDQTPIFLPRNYTATIREDIPGGSFVIIVTCKDDDSPTTGNGQVDVSIDEGSFGKFTVRPNGTLGNFFLTEIATSSDAVFDYDLQNKYTLVVKARDRGSPSNTGTAYVFIDVLDTNNKDPYFDPPTTSVSVSENRPVGFLVTTVTAKDNDRLNRLEVQFREPIRAFNPTGQEVFDNNLFQNLFRIDTQGNVYVNSPLDRDVVSFMTFTLYVQDQDANPPQEGFGALFIRILEYNDQAPFFELPFYNLSILEERPLSTFVGSILARDEDDQIRAYQLSSNPGNLFTISITSGVLQVNGRLDYETQHNVTLVAEAFDNGSPSLSNSTVVFVNIININDNTPVFNQSIYRISLLEESNPSYALVGVSASDRDEGDYGVVRYSVDDPKFRIDSLTGEIFLKPGATLDREESSTYTFQVVAYDSPLDPSVRLNTTAPVFVTVEDANDNCPIFSQRDGYRGTVIETADVSDQVVELFATDLDSGLNRRIQFSIDRASASPPDGYDLFSIQSIQSNSSKQESGRIEVKTSLRNKPGIYNFTVIAADTNGRNASGDMCITTVPVTVRVQEAINDAPTWVLPPSSNFSINVLESQYDGMLVYDCHAVDKNTGPAGKINYFFNVQQQLTGTTAEFRINSITCVIRAQIVFDREQVDSYVLTVVAKDEGDPSASSETVLIVNVLDVNDNDPEFPMRNGETIPINFEIPEGADPATVGVIGVLSATDKDSDHKNNKIYYRIVAGNDDNLFDLNRENGTLRLNPVTAASGLDREKKDVYSMDVLAFNDVNDDSVIRNRRKRSTNPSIVTVNVRVEDSNDTPPRFTNTDYYGCVSLDARYGQSILKVEAVDEDLNRAATMQYTKASESTNDFFTVDPTLGVIRNRKLLQGISSRQPIVTIRADDNADTPETEPGSVATTEVKIFVTDRSNEVVLLVSQPSADVRFYKDQLIRVMQNSSTPQNPISYVCIREIRDHVNDDGTVQFTASDVFVSAVGNDGQNYFIYPGGQLQNILMTQLNDEKTAFNYRTLYVQRVETDTESDEFELTEDPVLAVFIIAILLIFLAIILFCLACFLIRNSKKKKMKKVRLEKETHVEVVEVVRQQPPPEVVTSVNPVYDNKAYTGDEYAVVQKRQAPELMPVSPPIVPVVVPASDDGGPDVYIAEPIPEAEPAEPVEPEPVIVTEPIMSDESPQQMAPPPDDFFDPEPVIETEVLPDEELPGPADDPDDVIEVEIRDSPPDSPRSDSLPRPRTPTPPRSNASTPPPATTEEYRIETNVM